MSNFSIGLSGLSVASRVMRAINHNIANADTPGFRKLVENNIELGPFPTIGGVDTKITRAGNQFTDRALLNATYNSAEANSIAEGMSGLNEITSDDTLEKAYSSFMESSHSLLMSPNDSVRQEAFNQAGERLSAAFQGYQGKLDDLKTSLNLQISYKTIEQQQIQSRIQDLSKNADNLTDADQGEIDALKLQLMNTSGSIAGYNQVLGNIIPSIELAYKKATEMVTTDMNTKSGKAMFTPSNEFNRVSNFSGMDLKSMTEHDSHGYNTELGRLKVIVGSKTNMADSIASGAGGRLEGATSEFNAAVGVDLTEQIIKMKQYQQYYEANLQVIKTQSDMIGSLLDIMQ